MIRSKAGAAGKTYTYYICSESKHFKTCSPHRIRADYLEKKVTKVLQDVIAQAVAAEDIEKIIKAAGDGTDAGKAIQDKLCRCEEEFEHCERMLLGLYEDYRDGTVDRKDFAIIKRSMSKRRDEARDALSQLKQSVLDVKEAEQRRLDQLEKFRKYKSVESFDRMALTSLVREVKVYDKNHIEVVMDCDDVFLDLIDEGQVV